MPWEVGLGGALIGGAGEARGSLDSWIRDRALLEDRALSWGQLGRAGWSAVEGGVVGRRGSPNLLSDQPLGHSVLAGEVRAPAWGLCVGSMRALGMWGVWKGPHL